MIPLYAKTPLIMLFKVYVYIIYSTSKVCFRSSKTLIDLSAEEESVGIIPRMTTTLPKFQRGISLIKIK